jgi:hypothetical protein
VWGGPDPGSAVSKEAEWVARIDGAVVGFGSWERWLPDRCCWVRVGTWLDTGTWELACMPTRSMLPA